MRSLVVFALLSLLPDDLCAQLIGDTQSGLASYYSTEYDGAETAYGVVYDRTELVAAHKTYPYNSTVRVRNEDNGRTVTVRIIDKGPFIRGRIIELSELAARDLGMYGERTAPVEVTLLATPDQPNVGPPTAPEPRVEVRPDPPRPQADTPPAYKPPAYDPTPKPVVADEPTPPAPEPTISPPSRRPAATFGPGLYKVALDKPSPGQYGVQVGSYASLESAMDRVVQLRAQYFDDVLLQKLGRGSGVVYKVVLGPFDDQASAQHYARSLQQRYGIAGFTVELTRRP